MTQENLFSVRAIVAKRSAHWTPPSTHGYFHNTDPVTSRNAAAAMIASGNLTEQAKLVYEAFVKHQPCTPKELAARSGYDYYMIQRRISDLKKLNLITGTSEVRDNSQEYKLA